MSARRWLGVALCLLALPAWAQQTQGDMAPMVVYPPDVTLNSPQNGAQYTTGQTVTLDATALDMGGGVGKVQFLVDGAIVLTDYSDPYTGTWTATLGTHTVAARGYDDTTHYRTTPAVTITVVAPNVLPTVSLTAPANGASYTTGATVAMTATASDSDGSINRVEFWVDGAMVGQDSTSPYAYNWTSTTGSHTVQAHAVDNQNGTKTTTAINITVTPPNVLPTVSLTAPANGASYTTGATVAMTATASDSDGSIDRVEFLIDGTEVGQDTSSPYAYNWTSITGNHTVQARAVDNQSGTKTTTAINITVTPPNVLPTVSLTAPANGASYTTGATVAMTATASDSDGSIDRVEFLVDGNEVGQDTSSPYAFNWTATTGSHTVQARAVDNQSGTKTTTAINITVTPPNVLPTVSLTAPANGASYTTGATVAMTATASDSDGSINRVEFWVDGAMVGQDSTSPYAYNWPSTTGSHTVQVHAVDNQNGTKTTTAINITVTPPNVLPTVSLTAPANGASYTTGAAVAMAATASDSDGSINRVEFWVDGAMVGQDSTSPYAYNWTSTTGSHTVQAHAVDNQNGTKTTTAINITVTPPNVLPTVSLTAPANGASYTTGATVAMAATASDSDGSINRVEFLVDGNEVGQDTVSPYTYNWTSTTGSHTVQARAVDNLDAVKTTTAISISVAPMAPTLTLPSSSTTGSYTASWTSASGATHYELSEQVGSGSWSVIQDTSAINRNISGKTDGSYSYRVRACAGTGTGNCSAYSTTKTISVAIPPPTPGVPTLTLPTSSSTGSYTASWTSASGATHYELSEQVGSGSWSVIQDTSAINRNISGKTDGSYSYRVRACAGTGTGNCSTYSATKTISVTIPPTPPAVPTLTLPTSSSTGSYTASWTSASGATHYELIEQIGSGSWSVIQDTSATSVNISGKTDGSYSYLVRACAGTGTGNCSGYSATKTITIAIPPPPTVSITRAYRYNSYQELCGVDEPETGTTLMGYDAAGNLAWSASGLPEGTACSATGNTPTILARKAVRTYDARNRISTLTFPDNNGNQAWDYTPDGLPESVTTYNDGGASSVINSYLYNKRRLPVSETLQADTNTWTVGYAYTGNAHLATLTYPDSLSVAYAPNALGQPTQAGTYATNVTYYPNGAIAGFTYGNGIVHTLTQNARGLPDRSRDVDGSTSVHDDSYDYDPNGNVLAISDGVAEFRGDRDMLYDDLNRLIEATSPMFGTASYSYDVLDNLTQVHVTGGSQPRNHAYCYDSIWRLTNVAAATCSGGSVIGLGYDVQGNLTNKNGVIYGFDYGNRMRSGGPETYRYDAHGRRVRSSSSAGLVHSFYSQSGQILFQRDERSSKRRQYIYLGGSLLAEHSRPLSGSTATITYQHTDALGTPVAITNASRTVTERREYEPYGYQTTPVLQDGPNYTGHVADAATGLVYMQQRYYDPGIGRFLSRDPVSALKGPFNRYWYANASPYKFTDPDGRQVSAPKSCRSDNSCIPLNQVNRGDATMMKVVAAPVVVGGTAGLATATGATAVTVATVRTVTPKVVEATATATNAVNSATTSVAVRAQVAAQSEAAMALSSAGMSPAAAATLASRITDPQSLPELASGVVTGFVGVDEPSTSVANLVGEQIGQRLRVDYENLRALFGGDE